MLEVYFCNKGKLVMNKIKDLIYNSSDIIIAILILVLAAVIILWRLGIILEYPKEIIGTGNTENVLTEPEDTSAETDAAAQTDATAETDAAAQTETADGTQAEAAEGGTQDQAAADTSSEGSADTAVDTSKAVWEGDALAQTLDVYITGNTATATVQCLVDAGVFKDYAEYKSICKEMGYDDEKMRAGDFSFEKGATKKDIIKQVNYSG